MNFFKNIKGNSDYLSALIQVMFGYGVCANLIGGGQAKEAAYAAIGFFTMPWLCMLVKYFILEFYKEYVSPSTLLFIFAGLLLIVLGASLFATQTVGHDDYLKMWFMGGANLGLSTWAIQNVNWQRKKSAGDTDSTVSVVMRTKSYGWTDRRQG